MNKRGAGVSFIALSAILFIFRNFSHYLVTAIIAADNGRFTSGTFESAMGVTKTYSVIPEVIALILGIIYLIWSEIEKEK